MRFRYAFIVVLIALVVLTTMSVIGQEEPLPPVRANARANASAIGTPLPPAAYVSLMVEPLRGETRPTSLADAARNNDYVSFSALYDEARRAGRDVAPYDTLHQLWNWSMNDPVGAFYGTETYERLRAAYPGYAAYIEDFRIVDRRGAVFYPTSETRAFLLERALAGNAPRTLLAETARGTSATPAGRNDAASAASTNETVREPVTQTPVATTGRSTASREPVQVPATASAPRRQSAARSTDRTTTSGARQTPATTRGTTTIQPPTPVVAAAPAVAPVARPATTATPAQAVPAPLTTEAPAFGAPAVSSAVDPVVASPVSTDSSTTDAVPLARESVFANRGLLLLIIGLVGIGLLAVMLRTPQELPTSIMPNGSVLPAPTKEQPAPDASAKPEPGAKVEPMRPKKHAGGSR